MRKKLLALLVATAMSMTLIACGGSEEAATTEVATEEATVEEATVEEAAVEETAEMSEEEAALRAIFTGAIAGADEAIQTVIGIDETTEILE